MAEMELGQGGSSAETPFVDVWTMAEVTRVANGECRTRTQGPRPRPMRETYANEG